MKAPCLVALVVVVFFALSGCGMHQPPATGITPPAAKVTTPELVRDLTQENKDLGDHLETMHKAITEIPDADPVKAVLLADFMPLPIDWSKMNVTLGYTTKSVAADVVHTQAVEKENADLKANDPQRAELSHWGIAFVIAGAVAVALWFFAASIPYVGPIIAKMGSLIRDAGLLVMLVGFFLITAAHFLPTVYAIIGWSCAAAGVGVVVLIVAKLVKVHWDIAAILAIPPPVPKVA